MVMNRCRFTIHTMRLSTYKDAHTFYLAGLYLLLSYSFFSFLNYLLFFIFIYIIYMSDSCCCSLKYLLLFILYNLCLHGFNHGPLNNNPMAEWTYRV